MNVATFIPCYKLDDYFKDVVEYYPNPLVISKSFKDHGQVAVRNEGIQALRKYDYVWTVDADEIILKEDQRKIIDKLKGNDYDAVFIPVLDYASDSHIYEMRDHMPVVLVNPNKVEFYETRCVRFNKPLYVRDVYLHHLGFMFGEEKIKWKNDNYWNTGNPKEAQQIMKKTKVKYNTPDEIKDIINRR